VVTSKAEWVDSGPLSPDKLKIAMGCENDLVIWGPDEGELTRVPVTIPDATKGPIAWSSDSQSLVYL